MPKFLTLSPTHVPGKKKYAWNQFLKGNYISLGWDDTDYTGWSNEKIVADIKSKKFHNEASAIDSHVKFLKLEIGDYVGINNVNHGLFGIGKVTSGYKYKKFMHDTGAENIEENSSHYRKVEWVITTYMRAKDIIEEGDEMWAPYGTVRKLCNELPNWVKRILGEEIPKQKDIEEKVEPDFLTDILKSIRYLKEDKNHEERAHESLVEDFLVNPFLWVCPASD